MQWAFLALASAPAGTGIRAGIEGVKRLVQAKVSDTDQSLLLLTLRIPQNQLSRPKSSLVVWKHLLARSPVLVILRPPAFRQLLQPFRKAPLISLLFPSFLMNP
jgi:hypothetical protein